MVSYCPETRVDVCVHEDHERKALVSMPNSHLFPDLFMCTVELALKGALFPSPQQHTAGAATARVIYGCMCTCVSTDHTTKLAVCALGLSTIITSLSVDSC